MSELIRFCLIWVATLPLRFLPYRTIHALGHFLGTLAYYLLPKFRKKALSNLALARRLNVTPEQTVALAKASMQNLMITCLEYAKLRSERDIARIAQCQNPEVAMPWISKGQGVIFFCGHQANWEVLFLEGTRRMPGVAIGRPIKNRYLYAWVQKMRQKYGGRMIAPKSAIFEGMKALKKGAFLGIVGDQGMPDSGFSSSFLGRTAFTSPLPALLAHRTGAPLFVATTRRVQGRYLIHYSEPILPDLTQPASTDIHRMMQAALQLFEESIVEQPGQWLWPHNRWKQQVPGKLKKKYRHDALMIILPQDAARCAKLQNHLSIFRELYPTEWICVKTAHPGTHLIEGAIEESYRDVTDLLTTDYRPKLIFDFSGHSKQIKRHFRKLSGLSIIHLKDETCLKNATFYR